VVNKPTKPTVRRTTQRPVSFTSRTATTTVGTTVTTIPTGAVQAGAGGTSVTPATPASAIGLAGGSLALLLASAGLAVRRRGTSS
jgi:hypothetical protein